MYLNENIGKLKRKFPYIEWDTLLQQQNNIEEVEVEVSPRGIETLKVCIDSNVSYIHSKYDPLSEARRIVDSLDLKQEDHHLLFYGIGLGYVLDIIKEKKSDVTYSIYEPNPSIFLKFISLRKLSDRFIEALRSIYIKGATINESTSLLAFFHTLDFYIKPIILPSYERIYAKDYGDFCRMLRDSIVDKRFKVGTKYKYEKSWVKNTMINFPYTIKSENILQLSEKVFRGKPAILVSSGPSLDEEIDNLRIIKEKGLAYIFSAGSAVYKLQKHGIFPDAVCAIDGSETNYDIYKVLFNNPENTTPMIYADMLYNRVVSSYNAKLFNVIMGNDLLASYYLKHRSDVEVKKVRVAPSVALITLQILHRLQCDPIVLVGQNLALKNDYYYASGIDFHKNRQAKEKISENDRQNALLVEDVNGNMIYTLKNLDVMRRNMELLIEFDSINNVINTTKGGARIKGTKYMPLADLMNERLNTPVVDPHWYETESEGYDMDYVMARHAFMLEEHKRIQGIVRKVEKEIESIEKAVQKKNEKKINMLLFDFSKTIKELTRNKYYEIFVYPMNSLRVDLLVSCLRRIAREEDVLEKGRKALKEYRDFIDDVKNLVTEIEPYFQEFSEKIQSCVGLK